LQAKSADAGDDRPANNDRAFALLAAPSSRNHATGLLVRALHHFDNWDPGPLKPGERLFIDTGQHRETAMINYSLTEDRYIISYREAAEALTAHVMQGGVSDLLVFPILFAYRHWLELELKSLITLGQRWRGEDIKPMRTHKLGVLWPLARAAIEATFPDDPADLDTVASIVDELAAVDPASTSFRYARDRKGQVNLPAGLDVST
jgi:hypothetical protein